MLLKPMEVAVVKSVSSYCITSPFHPDQRYPELQRLNIPVGRSVNPAYRAVREAFVLLGLDRHNIGTAAWNPMRDVIQPGKNVVIKPNLVLHEFGDFLGCNAITTHGSIIRAVLDYVFLATGRDGSVVIADAPLQAADFDKLIEQTGISEIQDFYWKSARFEVKVSDLRQACALIDERSSLVTARRELSGDPLGYSTIDLGHESRLSELDAVNTEFVVGDYDTAQTNKRHRLGKHEYVVANSLLAADAIISLPKLKTHSKVGLTVCLKNLIGIIGSKDCLPHHRHGRISAGGDEFPSDYPTPWLFSSRMNQLLQGRVPRSLWRVLRSFAQMLFGAGTPIQGNGIERCFFPSGGWYGNDTIWRTVDDLNRIVSFYDYSKGQLARQRQRKFLAVVDGLVAMEGNGPLRGRPKPAGIVMVGLDPLAIDIVATALMGFDWRKVAMLREAANPAKRAPYSNFRGRESEMHIMSNDRRWQSLSTIRENSLNFCPSAGWRNHIEVASHAA
jgi:uncharacterized protein (DUF362 family)